MMTKIIPLLLALFSLALGSCATIERTEPFAAEDLAPLLDSGKYLPKAANFLVIFDASTSMTEAPDSIYYYQQQTKFEQARMVADYLNQTIPALALQGGLRVIGPGPFSLRAEKPLYGMTSYAREGFGAALATITSPGGGTPLAEVIAAAGDDLAGLGGHTALIIISDAEDLGEETVAAAQELAGKFPDNLCIYPILIGKAVDWQPPGEKERAALMQRLAKAGSCGFATDYETVKSPFGMAKFVTAVFFTKGGKAIRDQATDPAAAAPVPRPLSEPDPKAGPPAARAAAMADLDGDGINDAEDRCPGTPFGLLVDDDGCALSIKEEVSIQLQLEFDFDKHEIRPLYRDKLRDFLNTRPELVVTLEGHTDNFGDERYNLTLSDDRAASVKQYLVEQFKVKPARIKTKGYGYSRPLSANDSPEGRQRNRRVQALISGQ